MSALMAELPRAMAPKCRDAKCQRWAIIVNFYGHSHGGSYAIPLCRRHYDRMIEHSFDHFVFDRYESILLATVGDELWIALDHAMAALTTVGLYAHDESTPWSTSRHCDSCGYPLTEQPSVEAVEQHARRCKAVRT